jgi:hypothetical protein
MARAARKQVRAAPDNPERDPTKGEAGARRSELALANGSPGSNPRWKCPL